MSNKVNLEVTHGPIKGKVFEFEQHDTFLFGRDEDCHAKLAETDTTASRHHFLLEVNPPDACIRDLGSLNGTFVNEVKYGGREAHETPEDAAARRFPEVKIVDGDRIRVGETVFAIRVDVSSYCNRCGLEIPDAFKAACRLVDGAYTCPQCVEKEKKGAEVPKPPEPPRCNQCGKDVSQELGQGRRGDYVCESCRTKVRVNPLALLLKALAARVQQAGPVADGEFPGYQLVKELGRGGMGAVHLATRNKDRAQVAIKVMLPEVAVNEKNKKVFGREIDVTMNLRHPNIVGFYERGEAGGVFYFVLEFCAGGSVDQLMEERGGRLSLNDAAPIMLQSLEGLSFAHSRGIVHRDLKPQNILLTARRGGVAKIADMGLAKSFEQAGLSGMTVTGSFAGTPVYAPKEQLVNFRYVKPVTDVWSMAATFYVMLTGQLPRDLKRGQSPVEMVLKGSVIPIRHRDPSIPAPAAAVIDKALAFETRDRYQDAGEFLKALKKAL